MDHIFAWEIAPYCKISHDGMKQVHCVLSESLQLVQSDSFGHYSELPNKKRRKINSFVEVSLR